MDHFRTARRGPIEGENLIGHDPVGLRPGVPMRSRPSPAEGAPEAPPTPQDGHESRLRRAGLDAPTPVFGTAQPLHGLSGALRRVAYALPEHQGRHWLLLMVADRVDVVEDRVGGVFSAPLAAIGADAGARRVRANPLPIVVGLGGAVLGLATAWKLRR